MNIVLCFTIIFICTFDDFSIGILKYYFQFSRDQTSQWSNVTKLFIKLNYQESDIVKVPAFGSGEMVDMTSAKLNR